VPQPPPSRLGKYEIKRRLGGGGMAEVFVAQVVGAEGFTRNVAIKRVLPGHSQNPAFARMFITEARLLATLHHPNIVAVLDFDHDPQGGLFLVMELVEGQDLNNLLGTGLLPLPVVIHIAVEVLRGLSHAHHVPVEGGPRGIVHRDISPHNVLVSWEGVVKVSDFGLAKARAASSGTVGGIKGKPAYMSPEQANGQDLDGRSDLFAVGVMLWEMLVGQPLFTGATAQETLAMVLVSQIPSPAALRKGLPPDLANATMHLLERELPQRSATAAQAIHELMSCRDAPRDGRAELIKTMSDRFSNAAPTLVAAATDSEPAPSILTTPEANLPEIRKQMRWAQARSLQATLTTLRGHGLRRIAIVGALVSAVVITLIILSTTARRKASAPTAPAALGASGDAALRTPVTEPAPAASLPVSQSLGIGPQQTISHGGNESARDAAPADAEISNVRRRASKVRTVTNSAPAVPGAPVPEAPAPVSPRLDRDGDGIPDVR
jgi:serine/threonine protein kinase